MRRAGAILLTAGLLLMCHNLMAQSRMLPTRAQLDSLMHPALSSASDKMRLSTTHLDLGTIAAGEVVNGTVAVQNVAAEDVVITRLAATCSCLKTTLAKQRLAHDEKAQIGLTLNAAGRSGAFRYEVLIYTSLDAERPTLRLTVTGTIEATERWSHLGESLGALRVSRKSVVFSDVVAGQRRTERIACANGSQQPLRLTAHTTLEGLTLHTEPATLQPGEEGDILICYTATEATPTQQHTALIVEGMTGRPTERMISVTIRAKKSK